MKNLRILFVLLFVFSVFTIIAQETTNDYKLNLQIDNLNFVKNNEYFNHIADGYTLLGSQLHPKLVLEPNKNLSLKLGVFGLTYAGLNDYSRVIPTFSLLYKERNSTFIMGTLQSKQAHNMIAPILDFESHLDERSVENGLQYLYNTEKISIDTWLNWEQFIFKKDSHNEEFVMGLNANYKVFKNKKWQFSIPLQNTFFHRGGQINTNETGERAVFTMRTSTIGLDFQYKLNKTQSIKGSTFFVQNQSSGTPAEFIFDKGMGWFSNVAYTYNNWNIGVGHWYGENFMSPRGDAMFQSVSSKTDTLYINGELQETYNGYTDPIRSLILSNFSYGKELTPNFDFKFVFNGYFQNYYSNPTPNYPDNTVKNHFDFAMGLYVRYTGDFIIK